VDVPAYIINAVKPHTFRERLTVRRMSNLQTVVDAIRPVDIVTGEHQRKPASDVRMNLPSNITEQSDERVNVAILEAHQRFVIFVIARAFFGLLPFALSLWHFAGARHHVRPEFMDTTVPPCSPSQY
jgi:hypothetical protein